MSVRIATLPPEVRDRVARVRNRSALLREALVWYCRHGEALRGLASAVERLEVAVAGVNARLQALEERVAATPAVVGPERPDPQPPVSSPVERQQAAITAWLELE